jgi:hypothetical protein
MSDSGDSYFGDGNNPAVRHVRKASRFKTATAPITTCRTATVAGVGRDADRCYCACGGKKQHGKCSRGCDS